MPTTRLFYRIEHSAARRRHRRRLRHVPTTYDATIALPSPVGSACHHQHNMHVGSPRCRPRATASSFPCSSPASANAASTYAFSRRASKTRVTVRRLLANNRHVSARRISSRRRRHHFQPKMRYFNCHGAPSLHASAHCRRRPQVYYIVFSARRACPVQTFIF